MDAAGYKVGELLMLSSISRHTCIQGENISSRGKFSRKYGTQIWMFLLFPGWHLIFPNCIIYVYVCTILGILCISHCYHSAFGSVYSRAAIIMHTLVQLAAAIWVWLNLRCSENSRKYGIYCTIYYEFCNFSI